VRAAGEPLRAAHGTITHTFPTPDALATLARRSPDAFAMPAARRRTLAVLAEALAAGEIDVEPGADPDELQRGLLALPGIGPWTAGYIAMRALGQPDAFLASDLGVRRSFARLGQSDDIRAVAARAERWRPWRAYAVAHLWRVPPVAKSVPQTPTRARGRRKKIPTAAATTIGASQR
jgi:AraC family transcriptional regulator of adaptative response / DNA-3-methyladenine glycosylase II